MQKKTETTHHRSQLLKTITDMGASKNILLATRQVLKSIPQEERATRETAAKEMLEILEQNLPEQEKIRQILLMER